jgi:thiol-disulfide isomerase/thioredoxin
MLAAILGAAVLWFIPRPSPIAESPADAGVDAGTDAAPAGEQLGKFIATDPPVPGPVSEFVDPEGGPVTLASFKGRVVLVNLWATWCAPCVREMPSLDQLQQQMGGPDFAVLTISEDRQGRSAIDPFFEKNQLTHLGRYLDQKSALSRELKLRGLPTTLLIGRDGKEIGRLEGPNDWTGAAAKQLISQAIAQH